MNEQPTFPAPVALATAPGTERAPARRSALALAVVVTCQLMVALDASVAKGGSGLPSTALPDIRTALLCSATSAVGWPGGMLTDCVSWR